MKTIGIIVLIGGLLITLFTGISYVTREKVIDIGKVEVTAEKNRYVSWSPLTGIALMVVGGGLMLYGSRKQ